MDVEQAIARLLQLVPGAIRGKTAQPGKSTYEMVAAVGNRLKECRCGQRELNWQQPEYIAQDGDRVVSVGYDATSNIISCGDKGYHSPRYSGTRACV